MNIKFKLKFPIAELRRGYFTDSYFVKSREMLSGTGKRAHVLMQVFCKHSAVLCGVDETVALLRQCFGSKNKVIVKSLRDGDMIKPWETVMTLEGNYSDIAIYETIYLGILARRTAIATNVRRAVEAAGGKPVLFFGSRFDHYLMQEGDGFAAFIGGAQDVTTDANGAWSGKKGIGTIPHALIAAFRGNTTEASEAFSRYYDSKIVSLVDFDNDCVRTSLEVARKLGKKLSGVRLDTSEKLIDVSVRGRAEDSRGVSGELVRNVRNALDREGFRWVKIIISGGFNEEKLRKFNRDKVPFDAVGIGSWFFHDRVDFTADVVLVDGKPCAKVGRKYHPNPWLKKVIS
ncbi:MAG: nicotinate phosphoribosyltransferase [Candidatus Omnitrophica bacterium]|nr:nicotinate phosphoribosyltransferase [Candidatus Omnitrophota bacterium]